MNALYPVLLDLTRARVLVAGGGRVASRKIGTLLEHGSKAVVVAPELADELSRLVRSEGLEHRARAYMDGDVDGFQLVIAATSDNAVNARIAAAARSAGAWVNVADDPAASSFHLPAVLRQGEVTVALSTGGASPLLARRLRERLEAVVTPGLGRSADRLRDLRERVRDRWPEDEDRRRTFWFSLITPEFLDSAIAGRDDDVKLRIEQCLSRS